MCRLWRTAAGEAKRPKILQSVLLPVGDGPDTCGRELPVVRSANHYHRWGRADLLQPGMRGGRPVCFAGISQKLTQAARASKSGVRGKRVRLVCGTTSMYTGLDGLTAIIRYHLRCNPYDGSVYVFRDGTGSMLKYIEWDGQSFQQGKRRAQSGTYPWPKGESGRVVEISEKEFAYLLSQSIVPFKPHK